MKKKQILVLSIIALSLFIIPSALSKTEDNPFDQLWVAVNDLITRVTSLENNPNSGQSPYHVYHFTQQTEVHAIGGEVYEIVELAEFTLTPSNQINNRIWDMELQFELMEDPIVIDDEKKLFIEIYDSVGTEIAVMNSYPVSSQNYAYHRIQGLEVYPNSWNRAQYTIKISMLNEFYDNWAVRNIDLIITTLEDI